MKKTAKKEVKKEIKFIPYTTDLIQGKNILTTPEIRVWCHPSWIDKKGDDYYFVFATFKEAEMFIKTHKEAEDVPLIAFAGKEINIYDLLKK